MSDRNMVKMGGLSVVAVMWIIFITCLSVIIHNNPKDADSSFLQTVVIVAAGFSLFVTLYLPLALLQPKTRDPLSPKRLAFIYSILIPVFMLIVTSLYNVDKFKKEEDKQKAKACKDAAISLFVITLIFYLAVIGLKIKGSEEIKAFIEESSS
jgi:hypothetical protein